MWARLTRLAVIAASLASCSTPWTNERSTLIMSTGKRRSCPSDENPVPKSSIAMRDAERRAAPRARRARCRRRPLATIAVSVTSRPSRSGGSPAPSSALRTSVLTPPAESCLPERLTQVTNVSGSRPSRCQRAVCSQASRRTNSPSGTIRPVASAIGMNWPGHDAPRVGECQRSSASTPTIVPAADVDLGLVVDAELAALRARAGARARARAARRARGPCRGGRPRSGRGRSPSPRTWRRRRRGSALARAPPRRRATTMPMLAPTASSWPATDDRVREAARGAGRRRRRPAASLAPSSSTANSSPPRRASVSLGRVTSPKRSRDLLEQLVAGVVAEAVVDLLEAVEVDEQDGQRLAASAPSARAPGRAGRGTARGWRGR